MHWLLAALLSTSVNFGEQVPSSAYSLTLTHPVVEQTVFWDTTNKYTGAGYILGYDADVKLPYHLLVGVDYHYRNGGPWAKRGWGVRAGVGGEGYGVLFRKTFFPREVDESKDLIAYIHAPLYRRVEIVTHAGVYYFPRMAEKWSYLYKLGLGYRLK